MTHTATILPFPTRNAHQPLTPVRLLHLDGRPWMWTAFLPGDAGAPWAWVQSSVAEEHDCDEDAVGCAEGPNGEDWITVSGKVVCECRIGHAAATRNKCD